MLLLRFSPLLLVLALSAGCRSGRSSSIRSVTCCTAYQHSDSLPALPEPGTIRLAIGGDSRDDRSEVVPWAFREAIRRGAKDFVFLGDLELTPSEDKFFVPNLKYLQGAPFYPVIGNHEVETFGKFKVLSPKRAVTRFKEQFLTKPGIQLAPLPDVAYTAEIENRVHFIALDNIRSKRGGFGEQLSWLAQDLKVASVARRVILVGMHKPLAKNPITTHAMDENGPGAIQDSDAALALFKQFGVAMVFVSHSHMYAAYQQGGVEMRLTGGLGAPIVKGLAEVDGGFHHFLLLDVPPQAHAPFRVEVVKFPGPITRDQNDESLEGKD